MRVDAVAGSQADSKPKPSILIINPNSTEAMTQGLRELLEGPDASPDPRFTYAYMTGPSDAPASIDDEDDALKSMQACTRVLTSEVLARHAGFVVACYSDHPLEGWLRDQPGERQVLGILGGSAIASILHVQGSQGYGIVSTGKIWETLLPAGIERLAREGRIQELDDARELQARFKGVKTTGLTAVELHETDPAEVKRRMVAATVQLVKAGDVGAVCLGCAGMTGMDESVREGCVEALGQDKGNKVKVVDGTKSAVELLQRRLAGVN